MLQLELMRSARKRMEKRVPKIVGAWLAGTFDKDRGVSRAASDGLSSFLNTSEKVLQFWKRCGPQILEFAIDAINETPYTLSDERSTTKDDADAKYYRVVGASLCLVLGLLQKLEAAEMEKLAESVDGFFAVDAVWGSATAGDSYVRKAVFQLLAFCLDKREEHLKSQLPRLGRILISDIPKSNQAGSALDYVKILTRLTKKYPEIWEGKKSPFSRLRPLLEKGSQSSTTTTSGSFWGALDQLVAVIPQTSITSQDATDLLKALRTGISNREEPRSNAVDAWTMYLSTVRRISGILSSEDDRIRIIGDNVYPLVEHYMLPTAERTPWALGTHLPIVVRALTLLSRSPLSDVVRSVEAEWERLSKSLISRMTNSLPEVSKDYQKSQQDIADEGVRWFSLLEAIRDEDKLLQTTHGPAISASDLAGPPSVEVLRSASELLANRKYKPFGAASLLSSAFKRVPHLIRRCGNEMVSSLLPLTDAEALGISLRSPSVPYLLSCLNALGQIPEYSETYKTAFPTIATSLVSRDDEGRTAEYITLLVADAPMIEPAQQCDALQSYIKRTCMALSQGQPGSWDLFEAAMASSAIRPSVSRAIIQDVVQMLGDPDHSTESALRALGIIAHKMPQLLSEDEALYLDLVTKLLGLMEVSDASVAARAGTLRLLVEKHSGREPPIVKVIQENLDDAGPGSLE